MAQFVFPGAFPLPNCIKTDEPVGDGTNFQTEASLRQIMECYWLVKTWRITATMPLGVVFTNTVPNWPGPQPPETETGLVCGYKDEDLGIDGLIGASLSDSGIISSAEEDPNCDDQPKQINDAGAIAAFFGGGFFNPYIGAAFSGNKYYLPFYMDINATISILNQSCDYESSSGTAISNGSPDSGGQKTSVPIFLKESTISATMWWYPDASDFDPSGYFKIEAVDYWPYNP